MYLSRKIRWLHRNSCFRLATVSEFDPTIHQLLFYSLVALRQGLMRIRIYFVSHSNRTLDSLLLTSNKVCTNSFRSWMTEHQRHEYWCNRTNFSFTPSILLLNSQRPILLTNFNYVLEMKQGWKFESLPRKYRSSKTDRNQISFKASTPLADILDVSICHSTISTKMSLTKVFMIRQHALEICGLV